MQYYVEQLLWRREIRSINPEQTIILHRTLDFRSKLIFGIKLKARIRRSLQRKIIVEIGYSRTNKPKMLCNQKGFNGFEEVPAYLADAKNI